MNLMRIKYFVEVARWCSFSKAAQALYVSRTAISKWESGRGYPSIDSLKEISRYFSVTIDDLLSGEKLISIAEKENKRNIQSLCDILFGIVDLSSFLLMILPLYPKTVDNYIYSVNLFAYTEVSARNRWIYWILFSGLILTGALKLLMVQLKIEKMQKSLLICSLFLSSAAVIVLAIRQYLDSVEHDQESYVITIKRK